jgi:hypothetical protein
MRQHKILIAEDERRAGRVAQVAPEPTAVRPDPVARPLAAPSQRAAAPEAASSGNETDAARLIDQGFALLRQQRVAEARAAWQEAHALDPENRMLQLNLQRLDELGRRG